MNYIAILSLSVLLLTFSGLNASRYGSDPGGDEEGSEVVIEEELNNLPH